MRWEDFGRLYPQLIEIVPEFTPNSHNLSWLFLFGTANTSTFIEGKIDPELITAWRWFAGRKPPSQFAPLISEILEALARNNNKMTSTDRPVFARYGLGEEFDRGLRIMELLSP